MKKLIGVMAGCIVAYYALDAFGVASMATAWANLVEAKNDQAANALNDVFHRTYCKHDQKIFDFFTDGYLMHLENKH